MASPQLEDGYTRIANEVIEAMARLVLNSGETRCLWFIWRQTYGFQKKVDRLSLSQFTEATGMGKGHVCEALASLKERSIIDVQQSGHSKCYGFQKDFTRWDMKGKQGRRGDTNAPFLNHDQDSVNREHSLNTNDSVNTETSESEDSVNRDRNRSVNRDTQKKERKSLIKNDKSDDSSVPEESSQKPKGRPLGPPDEDPYAYELAVAEVLGYGSGYPNKKEACAHAKSAQKMGITCDEAVACAEWMLRVNGAFWANQTMQISSIVRQIPAYRKSIVEAGNEEETEQTQNRYREVVLEPVPRAVEIFWSKTLDKLKPKVKGVVFLFWSENLRPVSINDSKATLGATSESVLDMIARYRGFIVEALIQVAGKRMDVEFVLIVGEAVSV